MCPLPVEHNPIVSLEKLVDVTLPQQQSDKHAGTEMYFKKMGKQYSRKRLIRTPYDRPSHSKQKNVYLNPSDRHVRQQEPTIQPASTSTVTQQHTHSDDTGSAQPQSSSSLSVNNVTNVDINPFPTVLEPISSVFLSYFLLKNPPPHSDVIPTDANRLLDRIRNLQHQSY